MGYLQHWRTCRQNNLFIHSLLKQEGGGGAEGSAKEPTELGEALAGMGPERLHSQDSIVYIQLEARASISLQE